VTKLTAIIAAIILGAMPVPLILSDPPAATAAPLWAQEPPPGPQLSPEEQEAWVIRTRAGITTKKLLNVLKTKILLARSMKANATNRSETTTGGEEDADDESAK
jgi:hypothetical protein